MLALFLISLVLLLSLFVLKSVEIKRGRKIVASGMREDIDRRLVEIYSKTAARFRQSHYDLRSFFSYQHRSVRRYLADTFSHLARRLDGE